MDMNAIDVGTIIAIIGLIYKSFQDKIVQAEQMGKLKQQVKSLESRAGKIDSKLEAIDDKLQDLIELVARLETMINQEPPRLVVNKR